MNSCLPVSMEQAHIMGMVDKILPRESFAEQVVAYATMMADDDTYYTNWEMKIEQRDADESFKMLPLYRTFELHEMWRTFYSAKSPYHQARRDFVYKVAATETPLHIALHRQEAGSSAADYVSGKGITPRLPKGGMPRMQIPAISKDAQALVPILDK